MRKRQAVSGRIEHVSGNISAVEVYQTTTLVVIAHEGDLEDDAAQAFADELIEPYKDDWFFDRIERLNYNKVLVHYRRHDPIAQMVEQYGGVYVHTTDPDGTEAVCTG